MSKKKTLQEQAIATVRFTPRDGIFLFTGNQVAFLRDHANASLKNARFFSCSLHAQSEILKADYGACATHERFATDAEVRVVRRAAQPHDRVWLQEMGCRLQIGGVDFAEIDSVCQYHLFSYAGYLALILPRMIEAHPEIERFYVIRASEPLPLDYDFDSDIAYAMVRYFCEQAGRQVTDIIANRHLPAHGQNFLRRPYSTGWITPLKMPPANPADPFFSIGFLPSTVPSGLRIIRDAQSWNSAITLFYSPWAVSAPRALTDEQEESLVTDEDRAWSAAMANQLAGLRAVMQQRLDRSTLPAHIIGNPHLSFQFDHIILRRWLAIAKILRGAMDHVAKNPLKLFIKPEVSMWEGAILSALYRQQGTTVLVAPHSGWPGESFDCSVGRDERAMVYSRLGGEKLQQIAAPRKIYHIGLPWVSPLRSDGADARIARCRALIGDKKLVVFISNPTEVSFLPMLDQPAHFAMVRSLGNIPPHLADKVILGVRRRSAGNSETNGIYRSFAGLTDQQLDLLDGLTFQECVELADCAVGINSPTSGYYDVFRAGKPLLHLQGLSIIYKQPDLPSEVLGDLTDPAQLWPSIEKLLFDETYRASLLERQSSFVAEDLRPDFPPTQSPIRTLLHLLLTEDQ